MHSVHKNTVSPKGKRHFFISDKRHSYILLVVSFFILYSFHVLSLSIQEEKKKAPQGEILRPMWRQVGPASSDGLNGTDWTWTLYKGIVLIVTQSI